MYTTRQLIKDIWSYLRPYKKQFIFASFSRLVSDIVWLYPAYALALLVNFLTTYEPGASFTSVYVILGLFLLAALFRYGGGYFAKYIGFQIGERVDLDAQLKLVSHLYKLDMSWHEGESVGGKIKRIQKGANRLQQVIRIWFGNIIEIIVNCVGMVFIISKFDTTIGIALIIFIITFYFFARFFRKRAVEVSDEENKEDERLSGLLFESVNNIRTVKVSGMASKISKSLHGAVQRIFSIVKRRIFWYQSGAALRHLYGEVFLIGTLLFIVFSIVQGKYEIGFLVLFASYFGKVWTSAAELADVSQDFAVAKYAIGRMQELLDIPVIIDIEDGKVPFPKEWKKISIQHLSFSYGEKNVLSDISFDIERGKKIGIVGLSGAGKSTLFKLLLKEEETYQGEILIDDIPLRSISKNSYLRYISVVLQETELFNASLRDNIILGGDKTDDESVNIAAQVAHVSDFLYKLPGGLDTIVGEKGIKLSGGEKQRVGIARAVFKSPHILLMDEATSHLDIESEKKIQESLHEFFKQVTAIVIAHRLTTIKEMDEILLLEEGKIIERGNYAQLYAKEGRFYKLWEQQKL